MDMHPHTTSPELAHEVADLIRTAQPFSMLASTNPLGDANHARHDQVLNYMRWQTQLIRVLAPDWKVTEQYEPLTGHYRIVAKPPKTEDVASKLIAGFATGIITGALLGILGRRTAAF